MSGWHYLMILVAGGALIFDTADQGIASAAEVGISGAFHVNKLELGVVISGAAIGAIISAALIGFVADRFGRRPTITAAILVFTVATAAAALSQNVPELLVARIVAGLGYGGLLPMAWAFGSEFAPAASRGRMLSWLNAFYGGGGALAYLIGLAVVVPLGWRWGFAVFLVPALLSLVVLRLMPEGVAFLVRRGRVDQARQQVERIEATVLRGRPRPEPVFDTALGKGKSALSVTAATKELFAPRNLPASLSILFCWPIPTVLMIGVAAFYPLVLVQSLKIPLPETLAFLTIASFLTIGGRLLSGVLVDPVRRLSPNGLKVYLAVGVVFIGLVPFVILTFHWAPATVFVLLCVAYVTQGMWAGCAMTYIPTVMPLAVRNQGLSIFSALTQVGTAAGPTVTGAFLQFGGLHTAVNWMLGVTLVSALLVAVFGRSERLIRESESNVSLSAADVSSLEVR